MVLRVLVLELRRLKMKLRVSLSVLRVEILRVLNTSNIGLNKDVSRLIFLNIRLVSPLMTFRQLNALRVFVT